MNRIFAVALVLLLVAGSAYAVDMETKGEYYVRGSYISNEDGMSTDDTASYTYYDQELDMTVGLKVSPYTKVTVNFEVRDQDWLSSPNDDSVVVDGADLDDNIEFKRVFGQHTFSTGTTVLGGLMTGKAWGTSFGDTGDGYFKVQALHNLSWGTIGGLLQKDAEVGRANGTLEDAEKDDGDTIQVFAIIPVGTHRIMPLINYTNRSDIIPDTDTDGLKVWALDLAAIGAFGSLGYEAEFVYAAYNQDWDAIPGALPEGEDYDLIGAYANAWMTFGATKVGAQVAYGSYDKDTGNGYGFGEDYTPTMFGADWTNVGATGLSEYNAVTLANIYAEFALSDAMSLYANGTYWMSNSEDNEWEDATGYEIDLGGDYKITENVTWGLLAAYGQFQLDEDAAPGMDDTDAFYRLYHKFTINF